MHEIAVPDLVLYEVANALRYSTGFDEKLVKESVDSLMKMDLDIVMPTKELMERAAEISYKNGTTLYDSIYIAMAELNNGIFVTADNDLVKKIKICKIYF